MLEFVLSIRMHNTDPKVSTQVYETSRTKFFSLQILGIMDFVRMSHFWWTNPYDLRIKISPKTEISENREF